MANAKATLRERQEEELEVIKSIYGVDVEDLRPKGSGWKPLDVRILLTPLKGSSGDTQVYVKTKLRVICPNKYPKIAPKISLEETKGISDSLIEELLQELQKQAVSLKGEVMIYDLAQTVQAFLHKHNKPPRGSFYDEMLQEKKKREEEQLNKELLKQNQERQTLLDEVEKRKELLKNEARRRDTRRSISESNVHRHNEESSSDDAASVSGYTRSHIYPNKCMEHRNSETLYFHKYGRQIKRGCCLGHSQKGCVTFTGMDLDTGQLLYITEWSIKYSQLEAKCNSSCFWLSEAKCTGHKVDDVITSVEKHVSKLSQLNHKNLIHYECVLCMKRKENVVIYLVQDFLLGTSVLSISSSLGWCTEGARMVAKGVLDALIFLHNKGVSHDHLFNTTVFMDNTGTIRCTDFSLVPNLLELLGEQKQKSTRGDLPALGSLIESLMPTMHYEMTDFVEKCKSDRTLSASELLQHPFLRISSFSEDKKDLELNLQAMCLDVVKKAGKHKKEGKNIPSHPFEKNPASAVVPFYGNISIPVSQSRLRTEFEVLKYLGKGAFGDVLKVRNILDNREYAIKRIPLSVRSRQLYKKMTREVELLSRLNHENVVRYFNSWIESTNVADLEEADQMNSSEWSISHESLKAVSPVCPVESDESSSSMWKGFMPNIDDTDSDGIEFVDSNGEVAVYDEEVNKSEEESEEKERASPRSIIQVMYIQMEFCEKCTLRTAIDENLYLNTERLWRFFREIAEGLSHIHQQGIIHRDLKPVNIFLDSRDQIKIGDFGLATTSFLALQSQEHYTNSTSIDVSTGTGKVGTTLYVAPELTGNASKSIYSQKVDMYTLGIILFEMSSPPFETGMERVKTIMSLRSPSIEIPERLSHDRAYNIIKWLLNHDPAQRPTAEELLSSDLVPPAHLEANELQEMLRHALANPQSKAYKHLVARCLQQESDAVLELTYHLGLMSINPTLERVKSTIISIFRKHGAIEVNTPLLTPLSKNAYLNAGGNMNLVKLMTHSGSVVILPSDLRAPFARHIAMSGKNMIRRYSVDRVFREKKVFNFHPKQSYECAFDIITPTPGNNLVDAELLSIAYEIVSSIPGLKDKIVCIRMNHTSLLKAILDFCNVPNEKYASLFENVLDYIEGRQSKFHLHSAVTSIMETSKTGATMLIDLLLAEFPLGGPKGSMDGSALRSLTRSKGDATSLAKGAIRELESVVSLAQSLGVTCPIQICAGLPTSFDRANTGGITWQMLADLKPNRSTRPSVLAIGERYDTMLSELQKQAQSCNMTIPNRGISGAGFSFSLDKLVTIFGNDTNEEYRAIDVAVCVSGSRPPLKDVTYVLRLLWTAGIRSGVVEASGPDEAQDLAKDLGAVHVILLCEGGALRVRSWDNDRFQEKNVTRTELVEYIQKLLTHETTSSTSHEHQAQNLTSSSAASLNLSTKNTSVLNNLPSVQVIFLTHDKMTANLRRRYENQVIQQMTSTLLQFGKKENVTVLVVELPPSIINAIVGAINPREILKKETNQEISHVTERFPKHKRYLSKIFDEIVDILSEKQNTPIVALYSISDSYFRIII